MINSSTKQRIVWLRDSFAVLQVPGAVALLAEAGLTPKRELGSEDHASVEAVVVGLGKFGADDARPFPNLKTVARFGAGADNVDARALAERRIVTTSTIDLASRDVAEFALAQIIMALRGAVRDTRALGGTPSIWRTTDRTPALRDATVGIVGAGSIGRETVEIVAPLCAKVLVWNRSPRTFAAPNVEQVSSVLDLAHRADAISIHVALSEATRGLLGRDFFDAVRAARRSIAIVNSARGEIIDEAELLRALDDGTVHDAAIDVWSAEGPRLNEVVSALRTHPRVLATSHIGSHTEGVLDRYAMQCARNVAAVVSGRAEDVATYVVRCS